MNISEARQIKMQIGKQAFDLLYPQFANLLSNPVPVKVPVTVTKNNVEVPLTATLVSVAEGKQTATAKIIKEITGWTVKASTDFIKEGDFPKVINTVVISKEELQAYAEQASADTCILKVN
jgi:hypothetical protein